MIETYVELARTHALLLIIALPLVCAAVLAIGGPWRLTWSAALIVCVANAVFAVDFAMQFLSGRLRTLSELPVALHADGLGVMSATIVAILGALAMLAAGASASNTEKQANGAALALLACMSAGWCAALFAGDLIALVISIEAAWLAAVGLVGANSARDRGGVNGALRMLVIGGVSAAFALLGAAMLARALGSTRLDALPFAYIAQPNLAGAGTVLILASIAVKAGLAPLQAWAVAAIGRSSGPAILGLGVVGLVGALGVLIRFSAYAMNAPAIASGVAAALAVLGAASVVFGAVQAVGARTLPRLAVYACACQAGCITLSVALGSPAGFAAALVQLVAFAAAGLALFGGAAVGRVQGLSALDGYGQRAPLASAAITAGALSLMGAPLTIGFLGRWRLVEAGVGAGWWWAIALVAIASLAGVFYAGRLVERMYFRRAAETFSGDAGAWRVVHAPPLLVAIGVIAMGLAPAGLLNMAAAAAALMMGVAR